MSFYNMFLVQPSFLYSQAQPLTQCGLFMAPSLREKRKGETERERESVCVRVWCVFSVVVLLCSSLTAGMQSVVMVTWR